MQRSRIANALMCVPVIAGGRCLGTLTTLSFSPNGRFSAFDLALQESLATQIAVAYQRSRAYQTEVSTSRRLDEVRRDLARKNEELDRAVSLHETLLRVFSANEALTDQLDAVARLFEVAFHYENVFGVTHAINWTAQEDDLNVPILVADERVGGFLISRTHDDTFLRALFGTVATFVALEFMRDVSRMDIHNARRKSHFEMLAAAGDFLHGKVLHGFRPDRFNRIFAARVTEESLQDGTLALQTLLARMHRIAGLSNALIFYENDCVICLVSGPTAAGLNRAVQAMSAMATADGIAVGTCEPYERPMQHIEARCIATDCADALSRRGRAGLLHERDLGVERLLKGRCKSDILGFAHSVLEPLTRAEHSVLYRTLMTYIAQNRSPARAAGALGIHPNTLYQRLDKIEALTGRRLAEAADVTLVSLACQLLDLYGQAEGEPACL